METKKTPVKIKMTTEIRELGQKDVNVLEEEGMLLEKGKTTVLTFVEHQEEDDDVNAMITIYPEKVSVKRTGPMDMFQQFRKKQVTENVYRHAYGTIHMETHTDQITYQKPENGSTGKLFISYTTKLNGEGERRHRLTITMKEVTP
ncbi:DUF1934 domain-containing protein [Aquibacillus koreensis]|uniref:DUF1934 domain-containing protein n=1 Tax=Aquibacillus koreensis TaxID=279446 RepID=A0A9X3WL98_9BACI|nr:DUF1934 domain-containing protein [Aquibacillus koreensis]MCT2538277.1 DUF1934 domain-containing protein [Aquibacillus koreensis]MDC3420780.1 DUF1934 domain-containing protein [Aquibacillus koreensis]